MNHAIPLAHGVLEVAVTRASLPLEALCGFASRRNPRRPFLFVSRVLGRHVPTDPRVMAETEAALAALLDPAVPGPVTFLAMAETAVGLGEGVFSAWLTTSGRTDALFLPSTRYRLSAPVLLTFEERHSHAIDHLLYQPARVADRAVLAATQTLVLIDDEASTGATFAALVEACRPHMPALARVVVVTLTDWRSPEARDRLRDTLAPIEVSAISLLEGRFSFTPNGAPPPALPNVVGTGCLKDHLLGTGGARLGLRRPRRLPAALVAETARPGERILVLGTGEFVYPPSLLARHLAAQGARVDFQATTRSPILVGPTLPSVREFPDAYEDQIPNYLYGVQPEAYDRILVGYETPPHTAQASLLADLKARALHFPPLEDDGP
ncbi:phosphoribosyltransferase domain-containing protein [Pararhodospirillum photometricum]|uniref:phosphoribosyltransferase domain-containing protein n=1 Tax=Pararhodospirillum photometricum TaxID=1084 RepID=UPI001F599D46|nr:phosphoribosyltransferase domain-containing protein [Pararhodospirillum photometricum]